MYLSSVGMMNSVRSDEWRTSVRIVNDKSSEKMISVVFVSPVQERWASEC